MPDCRHCGGAVSPYASNCGHCGTSFEEDQATKYCSDCNGENRSVALYCRHCGTPLPEDFIRVESSSETTQNDFDWLDFKTWNKEHKQKVGAALLVVVFGFLFFTIIIGNDDSDDTPKEGAASKVAPTATASVPRSYPTQIPPRPTPTRVPTPVPTPTSPPEPIRMDLADLLEQYDLNKVRANSQLRYQQNGKNVVSTNGVIDEVEEHFVVVDPVGDSDTRRQLYCYYADIRTALSLEKGQPVSFRGKISGTDDSSYKVNMFECEFEGIVFDAQPRVSAHLLRGNVVQVYCLTGSFFRSDSKGTGVILDPENGLVLTVHHVVDDENDCETIEIGHDALSERIEATVVKHCASIDRARLRVSRVAFHDQNLATIQRATAPAQVDQEVFFWGYGPGELRMEKGIVIDVWSDSVITDAYAVPGDSGSPVFNSNGHMLGTLSRSNRSDRAVFTGNEC